MANWIKPNGAKVTVDDGLANDEAALAAGWVLDKPKKKKVAKKKAAKK